MKKMLIGAVLLAAAAVPAVAQTHVSINIGDPGFFGMIDNRGYGAPRVYVRRPVIIERVRYYQDPIYLRVPPRHRQNWGRYCHRYDACGVPVLFVRDDWYRNTYAPRVRHVYRDGYRDHGYRDRGYRDGGYRDRPRHGEREVVYRDRPQRVVQQVVYRDRPQPVVVQNVVYRDVATRDVGRGDRHHGKRDHHGKGHDKGGHGRGHGKHKD